MKLFKLLIVPLMLISIAGCPTQEKIDITKYIGFEWREGDEYDNLWVKTTDIFIHDNLDYYTFYFEIEAIATSCSDGLSRDIETNETITMIRDEEVKINEWNRNNSEFTFNNTKKIISVNVAWWEIYKGDNEPIHKSEDNSYDFDIDNYDEVNEC